MSAGNVVRICLVGATGLIGSTLMREAAGRHGVRIVGVGRREVALPPGGRMEMLVGEPIDWPALIRAAQADVFVCALGTTIKDAGSQEQFRAIDHDLVRFCAEAAREAGIAHMVMVSSVGADRTSRRFYLSVKGETEAALGRLRFDRLDVLRPGLLRGRRERVRKGERVLQALAPLADFLVLRGKWRRFRSIQARDVALAILSLSHEDAQGHFVHEHDALKRLALAADATVGEIVPPSGTRGVDSTAAVHQGLDRR
ncbi:nucleoside-diphosphate-sugar epimerase [Novosphingobium sp. Rr 2-17]|uniref:NAD(P)H-binding protein n=1 Tax=Novosphingobium sp. Rr 2-17 TaxID=555793 RepID=UPI0002697B46|nr:NAD(P)H-binding protein [Novosphingobium sp. Rr 2-17]EIZ79525.1 nucleoside-diphosphate-sugar epimerase [Novosphingobium sp. Rr 2-17]